MSLRSMPLVVPNAPRHARFTCFCLRRLEYDLISSTPMLASRDQLQASNPFYSSWRAIGAALTIPEASFSTILHRSLAWALCREDRLCSHKQVSAFLVGKHGMPH